MMNALLHPRHHREVETDACIFLGLMAKLYVVAWHGLCVHCEELGEEIISIVHPVGMVYCF